MTRSEQAKNARVNALMIVSEWILVISVLCFFFFCAFYPKTRPDVLMDGKLLSFIPARGLISLAFACGALLVLLVIGTSQSDQGAD